MKSILFLLVFLTVAAVWGETFDSYADTAAMRQIWQEFDAGNPAPARFEIIRFDSGKALLIADQRDYSLVFAELPNPLGSRAGLLSLKVHGAAANPASASLTVVVRAEKNGPNLFSRTVKLDSETLQTVTFPVPGLAGLKKYTILLILNKSGDGECRAVVDDILLSPAPDRARIDGFAAIADSAEMSRQWPGFDAGNPAPDEVALHEKSGRKQLFTRNGSKDYAVIHHTFANPLFGSARSLSLRLAGAAGNDPSCTILLALRRSPTEPNFAEFQIDPSAEMRDYSFDIPALRECQEFTVVLFLKKLAGEFSVFWEEFQIK